MNCEHMNFAAEVRVQRLTEQDGAQATGFLAEVRVQCADCKHWFKFIGLPRGLDLKGAAMSVDAEEARLAISPDGLPSTHPLRGFSISERSGRT